MIKTFDSPAAPTFTKGCAAVWLIIALAFVALLLVPGAQARAAPAVASLVPAEGGGSTEGPAPDTEQAPPAPEEAAAPPAESAPAPEEAAAAPAESPPAPEEAPVPPVESPPVPEEAAAAPAESPPVPEQAPVPPAESPPAPEQAPVPVAESPPPAPEEAATTVKERTPEPVASSPATEAGSEGHSREGTGTDSQPESPAPEGGLAAETGPGVPIATASSAAGPVTPEIAALPVAGQSLDMSWPVRIFMRSPEQVVCGLSGSVAPLTAGWLGTPGALGFPLAVLAAAGSSPAVLADLDHGRQRSDSGLGDHSSPAVPGFPPGGSSGSSAAGSGSGASCASTSALPGLHLHAAPSWMRRLHLAQPLWRTSSFVLIRERPD
jgi:outer membrane biosynthesis protein TonB